MPRLTCSIFPLTEKLGFRIAVSLAMFILGFTFGTWSSRIPDIQQALSLSDAQLGLAIFAAPLGQLAAMPVSPWLIKHFTSRRLILASMILFPGLLIPVSLAPSFLTLCPFVFVFGFLNSLLNICNNTQAIAVERIYARSIMVKFHAFFAIGCMAGGFVGGLAASANLSPTEHFAIILAIGCLASLWAKGHLVMTDPARQGEDAEDAGKKKGIVWPSLFLITLGVVGFFSLACEGIMYNWNTVYFTNVLGQSGFDARIGYLAAMGAMVLGRWVADSVVNRFGPINVMRFSALLVVAGLLVFANMPGFGWAVLASILVGLGTSAVVPICYSLTGRSTRMSP